MVNLCWGQIGGVSSTKQAWKPADGEFVELESELQKVNKEFLEALEHAGAYLLFLKTAKMA
jgi:hypothetical protein